VSQITSEAPTRGQRAAIIAGLLGLVPPSAWASFVSSMGNLPKLGSNWRATWSLPLSWPHPTC
jgi:hypothetical protein